MRSSHIKCGRLDEIAYSEIRTTRSDFECYHQEPADICWCGLGAVWGKLPQRLKAFEIRISIQHSYYCPASNVNIEVNIAHIQATIYVIMIQQFQMLCFLLCSKIGLKVA